MNVHFQTVNMHKWRLPIGRSSPVLTYPAFCTYVSSDISVPICTMDHVHVGGRIFVQSQCKWEKAEAARGRSNPHTLPPSNPPSSGFSASSHQPDQWRHGSPLFPPSLPLCCIRANMAILMQTDSHSVSNSARGKDGRRGSEGEAPTLSAE